MFGDQTVDPRVLLLGKLPSGRQPVEIGFRYLFKGGRGFALRLRDLDPRLGLVDLRLRLSYQCSRLLEVFRVTRDIDLGENLVFLDTRTNIDVLAFEITRNHCIQVNGLKSMHDRWLLNRSRDAPRSGMHHRHAGCGFGILGSIRLNSRSDRLGWRTSAHKPYHKGSHPDADDDAGHSTQAPPPRG